MMSEKRFVIDEEGISDNKTDNWYCWKEEVVDLLNEQQATIQQLQAQLREKEQDEKLYANEILELRETNKEWLQFKSLGGDY